MSTRIAGVLALALTVPLLVATAATAAPGPGEVLNGVGSTSSHFSIDTNSAVRSNHKALAPLAGRSFAGADFDPESRLSYIASQVVDNPSSFSLLPYRASEDVALVPIPITLANTGALPAPTLEHLYDMDISSDGVARILYVTSEGNGLRRLGSIDLTSGVITEIAPLPGPDFGGLASTVTGDLFLNTKTEVYSLRIVDGVAEFALDGTLFAGFSTVAVTSDFDGNGTLWLNAYTEFGEALWKYEPTQGNEPEVPSATEVGRLFATGAIYFTTPPAPTTTLSATTVTSCGQLTVSGANFTAGAEVRIELGSTLLGTATATTAGAVSYAATIPTGTADGEYSVTLSEVGSSLSASSPVTVAGSSCVVVPDPPAATLSASTVTSCGVLAVTGANFTAAAQVRITLGAVLLGAVTADAAGGVTLSATIPTGTADGAYSVTLSEVGSSLSASAPVTVAGSSCVVVPDPPVTTLSVGTVTSCGQLTVTGANFTADAVVQVKLGTVLLGTATVDSAGAVSHAATIPTGTTDGAYSVTLAEVGGTLRASAPVTVAGSSCVVPELPKLPDTTLSTSTVTSCGVVVVTGANFPADGEVTVSLSPSTVLGTATADAAGAVSFSATIPTGTPDGDYSITVVDASGDVSDSAPVTVDGTSCVVPEVPGKPEVPGTPETPGKPAVPGTPESPVVPAPLTPATVVDNAEAKKLATTGADAANGIFGGAVALLLGAGLLVLARRRAARV